MATVRILLGIICLIVFGSYRLPGSGTVSHKGLGLHRWQARQSPEAALQVLHLARSQLHVREKTGHNDGSAVEAYLHYVKLEKGAPWCAAFVSWVFGQAGYSQPLTGWSPALFPANKRCTNAAPAMVFGIWFPELKRIAHCGFIEKRQGNWLITIEGNTNVAGSREGDGVYRKYRHIRTVRYFASWLKGKEAGHVN
ncbi:peptidoglycan-binding protein [Pedobacter aquatilis]|uniref:peptidoglycan-binding protein n=1 Tax=Pedobacter aquatilis TaxID=351343 RepID=UPI00293183BD|nr:peptidoglycan-binding protein [Pedobacter aquatilis]